MNNHGEFESCWQRYNGGIIWGYTPGQKRRVQPGEWYWSGACAKFRACDEETRLEFTILTPIKVKSASTSRCSPTLADLTTLCSDIDDVVAIGENLQGEVDGALREFDEQSVRDYVATLHAMVEELYSRWG